RATSRWAAKPVVVASANGLRAVQKAFDLVMQGADTLDAVIEGVKIEELDPNDNAVGYGGLPNAEGVVQLDASCMHGPTRRAAAARSAATASPPAGATRRGRRPAGAPGRSRAAWGIRRSSARASTPTTTSGRRARPDSGRPTSRSAAASSPWNRCGAA